MKNHSETRQTDPIYSKKKKADSWGRYLRKNWQYYVLVLPAVLFTLLFNYVPMFGIQIAFRNYNVKAGFFGSEWVGLKHFKRFLTSDKLWSLIGNTLEINIFALAAGLIIPILLAVMLNELASSKLKKTMQMILYAPHFISMLAVCGIIILFTQRESGLINLFIQALGGEGIDFLSKPKYFTAIYVISDIWQQAGWGTIIYLAALSGVDPQIVEAAVVDGVSRIQKIWYIDLPSILPTIITLLVLSAGSLLNVGYEKILLLQTPLNMEKAEVIGTYIYQLGIQDGQFSYATAIGLFNAVVNIIVLSIVNFAAKKTSGSSLW